MPEENKKYSDVDVRRILDKAMRLQKAEARDAAADDGLSFRDLQNAAMEAGIDPEFVRRAARDLEDEPASSELMTKFLGAEVVPTENYRYSAPVSEDALKKLLEALPAIVGMKGTGHTGRSSLSWVSDPPSLNYTFKYSLPAGIQTSGSRTAVRVGGVSVIALKGTHDHSSVSVVTPMSGVRTEVEVRTDSDGTDLRVRSRLGSAAAGIFAGIMGGLGMGTGLGVGLGVGIGALGTVSFSVLFPLGCLAGSYLLSRLIYTITVRTVKKNERKVLSGIRRLLDDVSSASGKEPGALNPDSGEQAENPTNREE